MKTSQPILPEGSMLQTQLCTVTRILPHYEPYYRNGSITYNSTVNTKVNVIHAQVNNYSLAF
jgi:hypothetical protein